MDLEWDTWQEPGGRSSVLRDCSMQTQACRLPSASTLQRPILKSAQGQHAAPQAHGEAEAQR